MPQRRMGERSRQEEEGGAKMAARTACSSWQCASSVLTAAALRCRLKLVGLVCPPSLSPPSLSPPSLSVSANLLASLALPRFFLLIALPGPASLFPPHRPAFPPPLVIALALTLSPFRLPCQRMSMCASMNEPVRRCARVRESNACLHWCASMNEPVRHCTRPFMHKQTTYRRETSKG